MRRDSNKTLYVPFSCYIVRPGLHVVLRHDAKRESQLTGLRKSVVSPNDNQLCYRQFFVGNTPPTGFPTGANIKYICQGACAFSSCFSTMYDLNLKIPIYSAYLLTPAQAINIGSNTRGSLSFRKQTHERGEQLLFVFKNYSKNPLVRTYNI